MSPGEVETCHICQFFCLESRIQGVQCAKRGQSLRQRAACESSIVACTQCINFPIHSRSMVSAAHTHLTPTASHLVCSSCTPRALRSHCRRSRLACRALPRATPFSPTSAVRHCLATRYLPYASSLRRPSTSSAHLDRRSGSCTSGRCLGAAQPRSTPVHHCLKSQALGPRGIELA